jgi:hypothetical protein
MSKLYSGMTDFMATTNNNNNITEFYVEITDVTQKLHSRGKNADDLDLTPLLLVTYMACGTATPLHRGISRAWTTRKRWRYHSDDKDSDGKGQLKYEERKEKNKARDQVGQGPTREWRRHSGVEGGTC